MNEFTPGQKQAIEILDRNLLVKAGAGAGKTRVLVERYVNILASGRADVESIVAITFTRKAAREMKQRVRERVRVLVEATGGSSEGQRWREIEQKLDHAPISTIHSLCSRILREYPAEAVVDPEFVLMEDADRVSLLAEIWQEVLDKAAAAGDPWLIKLLELYSPTQLCKEFLPLFERLHNLGLIGTAMAASVWPEKPERFEQAVARLKQAVCDLFDWIPEKGKMNVTQTKLAEIRQDWDKIASGLDRAATGPAVLTDLENRCKNLRGSGELTEALRRRKEAAQYFRGVVVDLRIQQVVPELCEWFCLVEQSWSQAKLRLGALTYDDLENETEKLLRFSPQVCEQFRRRVLFLMVDECQDINERQRAIIYLLAGGSTDELQGRQLFVVGDAKQSIYRFRGADNRVFSRVEADITASGGKVIELLENFRSHRNLVGAFNDFFQILMPTAVCEESTDGADTVEYNNLIATKGGDQPARMEMWVVEASTLAGSDAKTREAEMVAGRIQAMVADPNQAVQFRDVVILLRAFTHVNLYEAALAAAGIPYYVASGRGFILRQEVADALALIRFLVNPYNELALFAILRSPLFQLSDQTLLRLRRAGEEGGIWFGLTLAQQLDGLDPIEAAAAIQARALLEGWLARRGFVLPEQILREVFAATRFDWLQLAQFMGDRRYANLMKLLTMARIFAETGGRSLEEFLNYVELRAQDEGEAEIDSETGDTVRIMTIHKSKGLEFPVVIVPDLQRRFNLRNRLALFSPELGLGLKVPDDQGKLIESARYRQLARQDNAMEKAELKRLLYVAMTRAERRIILSAVVDNPKTEKRFQNSTGWLDWTRNLLGLTGPVEEWSEQLQLGETCVYIRKDQGQQPDRRQLTVHQELGEQVETEPLSPHLPAQILTNISSIMALPGKPKVLSPAYLVEYSVCPRRYFYAHVCRMPEARYRNALPDQMAETLAGQISPPPLLQSISAKDLGIAFHRFLELMTAPENWRQSMEQALQETMASGSWDKALETLSPWARKYATSALYGEICSANKEQREWSFQYRVLPEEQRLPAVWLSGQVDRVLHYDDGTLGIVDYKTDWIEPGSLQKKATHYQMQITGYALAVGAVFGRPLRDARLYFARTGETATVDIGKDALEQARDELQSIGGFIRSHDQEANYVCRKGHCSFCPFQAICLQE